MTVLHFAAFNFVITDDMDDQRNTIDFNVQNAIDIFLLLNASGADWSEDQMDWSGMLFGAQTVFGSMQMAPAAKIAEFFHIVDIDINQFDERGYNLFTTIASSETIPSTFNDSIPWDVYHLKTFLEFGVDPNTRTASGQNSLHRIVIRHADNLFCLHLHDLAVKDFYDKGNFDDEEDLGAWHDIDGISGAARRILPYKLEVRRYYENQFGKCERDVVHDAFFEKARLLIEAGCDLHARDSEGVTPSALVMEYYSRDDCGSILETWTEALRRCGLDIKDVLAIDQRDLATTTAVDFESTTDSNLRRRNPGM